LASDIEGAVTSQMTTHDSSLDGLVQGYETDVAGYASDAESDLLGIQGNVDTEWDTFTGNVDDTLSGYESQVTDINQQAQTDAEGHVSSADSHAWDVVNGYSDDFDEIDDTMEYLI